MGICGQDPGATFCATISGRSRARLSVMNEKRPDYVAYMLRVWRMQRDGAVAWRVSLKSAQTRECRCFASLEDLFDYLRRQAGVSSATVEVESRDSRTSP